MPITVLMTQSRKGVAGADLLAGQQYSLPNDLAIQLVGQKYAVDVHGVIGRATNADEPIGLSVTPTQLAASATAGLPVEAGTLLRDPVTGQLYGQSDGVGGYVPLGSSASGGGGSTGDSITATTRETPGGKLLTITTNGITWTYVYSGPTPVRLVAFEGTAYELGVDLTENTAEDFVEDSNDNTREDGGAVKCSLATAWALEAAAIAATITLKPGFKLSVTDCASVIPFGGSSPVYSRAIWTWNGLRFDYDFTIADEREPTYNTASGTSGDLATLVAAKEFLQRKHQRCEVQVTATGGVAGTAAGNNSCRVKLNGVTSGAGPFLSQNLAVSLTDTLLWNPKKTLIPLSNSAQISMAASSGDGTASQNTLVLPAINALTTDFTFALYNVQGANASLFTMRRFALRLHTRG
ncbi:MAG: hypothetical protein J0M00_25240 [Burkholderiales bacterium]|nr:hypothetical protein [Burkholderiales bacterium]